MVRHTLLALLLVGALLFSGLPSSAQKKSDKAFSKQLSFAWDNDYFVFKGTDRYYTNGLYFTFDKINKNKKANVLKKIDHFELGQMIYKQYLRQVTRRTGSGFPGGIGQIDRPITGYLFAKVSRSVFIKTHSLEFGVSAGVIGSPSLGEEVQTFWHKESGVGNYWDWVWDYQLKAEFGANVHGKYAVSLIKNPSSFIQISPITNVTIGTNFTNFNQSVLFQFGKFNRMGEGGFWNARIQDNGEAADTKAEVFLYAVPHFTYQVYNATIQGGMFRKDKGPIVSPIEPIILSGEAGLMVTTNRYSANLGAFFQSKEASTQFNNHAWGRVKVAYRFN